MTPLEIAAAAIAWWAGGFLLVLIVELFSNRRCGRPMLYPRGVINAVVTGAAGPLILVVIFIVILFIASENLADRIIGPGDSGKSLWPRGKGRGA